MSEKRMFVIASDDVRQRIVSEVYRREEGDEVRFGPPTRTGEQNAKFHAICSDIARSGFVWAGKRRTAKQIKVLLVSGHAQATGEGSEVVPGLEGEFINLRESTALMSKKRGSSLIEYTLAFCAEHGIDVYDEATA